MTLAIGVAAVATVFSALDRFLVRLPDGIAAPERVIEVYRQPPDRDVRAPGYHGWGVLNVSAFRVLEDAVTLEAASLLSPGWSLSVSVDDAGADRLTASFVSANYFDLLGARMYRGRSFDVGWDEDDPSSILVLSHSFWQRRFGGDPGIVGRTLRVEGRELTVIGIAAPGFVGTSIARAPDAWIPVSMIEVVPLWGARAATAAMFLGVARVRDGFTLAAVASELDRLGNEHYARSTFRVASLREVTVDPNRRAGFLNMGKVLFGAAVVLLLIACLNVANLLLARAIRRQHELSVRVAIGAGRVRLARQLFIESALLYAIGGSIGAGLLVLLRPWLATLRPPDRFFFSDPALNLPVDVRVLGFTLAATGACALVFGMLPAWRALRSDPRRGLHPYAAGSGPGALRARDALVLLQVAFCLVALAGAGLFVRGGQAARAVDLGFQPRNLGMVSVNLHFPGYGRDDQHAYYRRALEATRAVPGVSAAGFSWLRPLEFGPVYVLYGFVDAPLEERYAIRATAITPGYLDAAGMRLLAGRDFRDSDRLDTGTCLATAIMSSF
jgi:predicted permease